MKENKPHKNIRGAGYNDQGSAGKVIGTPMARLREFVKWSQLNGLCKSENDFERMCNLSPKYLANNSYSSKGNIGTEILGRIIRVFPQLNLVWLCIGEGPMLNQGGERNNPDYKRAYEAAHEQIEALMRILRDQSVRL